MRDLCLGAYLLRVGISRAVRKAGGIGAIIGFDRMPSAALVDRQNDRAEGDGTYYVHNPNHDVRLGSSTRFFKHGALPC